MDQGPGYLIIPAAGLGTRMSHLSPGMPKEMLPVGSKPAIHYAVYTQVLEEKTVPGCSLPGTVFDIGNPEGYDNCLSMVKPD